MSGKTLFYAQARSTNPVTLDALADEISAQCTLTVHDVKAVISALEEHIIRRLLNGNTVRLGDLGSFHVTLKSRGIEKAEEYTANLIEAVRVRFTGSRHLRSSFSLSNNALNFRRITLPGSVAGSTDTDTPDDSGTTSGDSENTGGTSGGGLNPEE